MQNLQTLISALAMEIQTCTKGYYISAVKLSTGKVSVEGLGKDNVLEGIVAYDKAERNTAYLGQVNMITVSSFSGPLSAVWGLDLAKVDQGELYANKFLKSQLFAERSLSTTWILSSLLPRSFSVLRRIATFLLFPVDI